MPVSPGNLLELAPAEQSESLTAVFTLRASKPKAGTKGHGFHAGAQGETPVPSAYFEKE